MEVVARNPVRDGRVDFGLLLWAGPLAIVLAAVANVFVQAVAVPPSGISPEFGPLSGFLWLLTLCTVIGVSGAVIFFALIARFSRRPVGLFGRISLVVLLLSFLPDVVLLVTNAMPGTSPAAAGAPMFGHVVAWAISVYAPTTIAVGR